MFPDCPEQLSIQQLRDYEYIDISNSGPLAELLCDRMINENVELASFIKVQTYFVAIRLVAKGAGICIVDRFTAEGNSTKNTAIASLDPPLTFTVNALYLEERNLSKVTMDFIACIKQEFML
jgi:DNA-binding transcriptional LysR family regulator